MRCFVSDEEAVRWSRIAIGKTKAPTSVSSGHEDGTWSNECTSLRQIVIEYNSRRRPDVV